MPNVVSSTCLSDDDVLALLSGTQSVTNNVELTAHLDGCRSCRQLLATVIADTNRSHATADETSAHAHVTLARRGHIGRYIIQNLVGCGGMGVVYSAFDPELERHVAIKLFRQRPSPQMMARLRGEGRLMALLSHPNIVTVHELGEHEGQLFIVMELVHGPSLRVHLEREGLTRADVLALFVQAAAGLAAAHEAGIIHCDFKPDNVLVGEDGSVKIGDFGLARKMQAGHHSIAGTPLYMAPEQRDGRGVDHRADQYAFAVSLEAALEARGWLDKATRRVLQRAKSPLADARFTSMNALVSALRRAQLRRRYLALAAVAAAIALVTGASLSYQRAQAVLACTAASNSLGSVWGGSLGQRFGDPPTRTRAAWDDVVPSLLAATDEWRKTYFEACARAFVEGEETAGQFAHRHMCFEQRKTEMIAMSEVLREANPEKIAAALSMVPSTLRKAATCTRALAEVQRELPDEAVYDNTEALAQLAKLTAAGELYQFTEYIDHVRALLTNALDSGNSRLVLLAYDELSFYLFTLGPVADLIAAAENMIVAASREGDAWLEAKANARLGMALAEQLNDRKRAVFHLRQARSIGERAALTPKQRAFIDNAWARYYLDVSNFTAALDEAERMQEAADREGEDRPTVVSDRLLLRCFVKMQLFRLNEALADCQQAYAALDEAGLAQTNRASTVWQHLSDVFMLLKRCDEATDAGLKALRLAEANNGAGSTQSLGILNSLANAADCKHDNLSALHWFGELDRRAARLLPYGHAIRVSTLGGIGGALFELHRPSEALSVLQRATQMMAPNSDMPEACMVFYYLAQTQEALHLDMGQAMASMQKSRALFARLGNEEYVAKADAWLASHSKPRPHARKAGG